jgi:hypothetical protein
MHIAQMQMHNFCGDDGGVPTDGRGEGRHIFGGAPTIFPRRYKIFSGAPRVSAARIFFVCLYSFA